MRPAPPQAIVPSTPQAAGPDDAPSDRLGRSADGSGSGAGVSRDKATWLGLALILLLWPASLPADVIPPGSWQTMAPASLARTEVAAAALDGKVYVVGGFERPSLGNLLNFAISTAVEIYDPTTDQWATTTPLPLGLHHVGLGVVQGRLYVIGGYTQHALTVWHPVHNVFMYDPATRSWLERSPMPTARGALTVAEAGGLLYAIGGYDRQRNIAAVEVYDPAQDLWSTRAPLPTPRDHLAAATLGGLVYAIGGRFDGDYNRNVSIVEVYDPATNQWRLAAPLPTARSGISAAVLNGQIIVVGGESGAGTFRTTEAFDPADGRWQTMAPMPTGRHGLGAATVEARLYVIAGGPAPGGSFSNLNEVFTLSPAHPTTGKAPPSQVGAVMALLATFQDGSALPREGSADANRLIKALIQFQAALMRSQDPAIRQWLDEAMREKLTDSAEATLATFQREGWTSVTLEAVVEYAQHHHVWEAPELRAACQAYNVGRDDFTLLTTTFLTARANLADRGLDIHAVYTDRRKAMPGASPAHADSPASSL